MNLKRVTIAATPKRRNRVEPRYLRLTNLQPFLMNLALANYRAHFHSQDRNR